MKITITKGNVTANAPGECVITSCELKIDPNLDEYKMFEAITHELAEAVVAANCWNWKNITHEDFELFTDTLARMLWLLGARAILEETTEIEV